MGVPSSIAKRLFYGKDGKFSKLATAGTGLNVAFTMMDYSGARDEGASVPTAVARAGANFALFNTIGLVPGIVLSLGSALPGAAVDAYDTFNAYGRNLDRSARNVPFQNSTFVDTQQAYTMRQAGMNLAKNSKYAVQQAMLGDEARMVNL